MTAQHDLNWRISELLEDPRETLDIEFKRWLDLQASNEHKAILAKAIIALANHGGGAIIIGMDETENGVAPATDRPDNLADYNTDRVNAIVSRYAEPAFHCDLRIVQSPQDAQEYPVILVPGGHHTPIRSKRAGPGGEVLQQNLYYIRRPGPQSAPPGSGQEWDALIRRCIANARDDLLDRFRILMTAGGVNEQLPPREVDQVAQWLEASTERWGELAESLSANNSGRLRHGHYSIGYRLVADGLEPHRAPELLEALRRGIVRHTGWPPFVVLNRGEVAPYPYDDGVECWMGYDNAERDPGTADYWRATHNGEFFLLRGYQEDGHDNDPAEPGHAFDLTLPVWRIGEVLLHAASMADQFGVPDARVVMVCEWTGLRGRNLVSWANPRRMMSGGNIAKQPQFRNDISVQADSIRDGLPELVDQIVRPLFELFDFFKLPPALVTEELARMRRL